MPSNDEFSLKILVGDEPLEEFQHGGCVYVESNLFTPVSYKQSVCETVNGELETQVYTRPR